MKILAIRGKNLASLAGEFEIDFVAGPLAELRLFAITGPTGVGKSTLLDALCLALFDRTPRLDFKRGPEIGRGGEDGDWLKSYDVRSLLRRGEAEGFAEVDFVGSDDRALRSTWSVGRARGRKDGKLQAQTMSLVDLATGASLGGTKTETLEAIVKRLGLTFEQFRKSVLLAQGEFAEFLKADANERSELLQRITGTEIYERISKAAFQKAREVRELLGSKERLLEGLAVLESADRERLEREIAQADEKVRTAVVREKLLEEAARKAAAARAGAQVAEAKEREARSAAEKAQVAETRAKEALEAAAARERELAAAKGAHQARRGEIENARELDVRLDAAKGAATEAGRRQEEAEGLAAAAKAELAVCEAAGEAARRAQAEIEGWLQDHAASRSVQERWDVWARSLDELVRTSGELAEAERSLARFVAAVPAAEKELAELEAKIAGQAARLEGVKSERKGVEGRLAAIPAAAHRLRHSGLSGIVEALNGLEGVRSRATETAEAKGEAEGREAAARAEAVRAVVAEAAARKAFESTESALAEARRALSSAESIQDLAARRAELVEGTPCPLCGATGHPWGEGAPIDAAVQTLRDRVLELDRSARKRSAEVEKEGATAKAEERKAGEERARSAAAAAKLAGLDSEWGRLAAEMAAEPGPALPAEPFAAAAKEAVAARLAAARQEQARLAEALAEADLLAAEGKRLLLGEEALRSGLESATAGRLEATRKVHEAKSTLDQAAVAVASRKDALEREIDALRPVLSGRPELEAIARTKPEAVRQALKSEAGEYARRAEAGEKAREAVAKAEAEHGVKLSVVEERGARVTKLLPETARLLEGAARATEERRKLLGGRPAAEVERELEGAVAVAEKNMEEARLLAASASSDVSASLEKAKGAAVVRDETAETARLASEALAGALADAGLEGRPPGVVEAAVGEARNALEASRDASTALLARRIQDDENRARREQGRKELEAERKASEVWLVLQELLGSADGAKFRRFAQSLSLEALVASTNVHLHDLARRYRLERVPNADMELQVVDGAMGDEARSVNSLSGGETFLVSLALALGLSSLATRGTRVESLFIDEGFGSLDADSLARALSVLDGLQATGRRVGVISHVTDLVERIGARVEVSPEGNGRSRVTVMSG